MLSILCVRLTIKVKLVIPESFKVGWYPPPKKLGRVTLKHWGYASSETQGQSVRSGEKRDESFQVRAKETLGTDSHRTFSKISSGCRFLIRQKKCFVLLCPIGEQFLLSSFRVFVHDGYCLDHCLSGSCTKEMHAVRKLLVWYKIPIWFQNTVCQKTKDTFPKIQASASIGIHAGIGHGLRKYL